MTDVIIIGAGAAGLMAAIEAGKRGQRVLVLDHAAKPAEKIRISGGGRCNFTNIHASPAHYLSQNPSFCVSALSRYTPGDFLAMVERHGIPYHEKTLGQLFCDRSAQDIIAMLLAECREYGVEIRLSSRIDRVEKTESSFRLLGAETWESRALIVACGGLSIPKMGATGFGYEIARQFGHAIVPTEAALVPFTLSTEQLAAWSGLSGLSLDAVVRTGKTEFREGMLFTHRGLSGPSVLQVSSYWDKAKAVSINLAPGRDALAALLHAKEHSPKQEAATVLSTLLPRRLAQAVAAQHLPPGRRLAECPNKLLAALAQAVHAWSFVPEGTEGYRTAEVTRGGVDTAQLSSRTMESALVPGLFFIGEVVDVTGHLGGFNFQWAWASGFAAGQAA